mmetsp:Transcript_4306/g.4820  ORF Transcript_4306/g.4820 Transcript_4306/m.4820 type:complete len:129 (-) Transcript_4306:655-1041(-)
MAISCKFLLPQLVNFINEKTQYPPQRRVLGCQSHSKEERARKVEEYHFCDTILFSFSWHLIFQESAKTLEDNLQFIPEISGNRKEILNIFHTQSQTSRDSKEIPGLLPEDARVGLFLHLELLLTPQLT